MINPMTGESVKVESPPNRLAIISISGTEVGYLRMPPSSGDVEVQFDQSERHTVEPLLTRLAEGVGGTLQHW